MSVTTPFFAVVHTISVQDRRLGNFTSIRCDNGSNFTGAEKELQNTWKKTDHKKISTFLLKHCSDWLIPWKKNPPLASHMGGVWERQIRSIRNILSPLLKTYGNALGDESFRTLMT